MTNDHKISIALGTLGAAALLSVAAFVKVYELPKPVKRSDVSASAKAVAGDQDLGIMCKAQVVQQLQQYGGGTVTVSNVKHTGVNSAKVKVKVKSAAYTGPLTCSFTKSNWQLQGVS